MTKALAGTRPVLQKSARAVPRLILYLLLFGVSFVFVYPFLYMVPGR